MVEALTEGKDWLQANKPHLLALFLCALASLFINWKICVDGIIYAADDIWWHILWLKEFISELDQGILYPRWLAQSNFLYGSPTFVFYPPLCFFVGAILQKLLSMTVMQTTTALCLLGTFSGGIVFYLCTKSRWSYQAALGGSLLFMTSPYLAFDIYFRASIPELCALTWLPLIIFSVDRLEHKRWRYLLALGMCLLALTHLPSLAMFLVVWFSRVFFCLLCATASGEKLKILSRNFIYGFLGLGAAAFFIVPVFAESSWVDINAVLDPIKWQATLIGAPLFRGYFVLPDIVLKSALIAMILFVVILFLGKQQKINIKRLNEPFYWLAINLLTLFVMSEPSRRLWQWCKPLQYLQMPYRWMGINAFAAAVLFAIATQLLVNAPAKRSLKLLFVALFVCLIFRQLGVDYLITKYRSGLDRPTPYIVANDLRMGLDEYARYTMPKILQGADGYPGVPEYRPLLGSQSGGTKAPPAPHHGQPDLLLVEGEGEIKEVSWRSYERSFTTDSIGAIVVKVRTFVYPAWRLSIDGKPARFEQAADGAMLIRLPCGGHSVNIKYEETDDQRLGVAISLISLCCLAWLNRQSDN